MKHVKELSFLCISICIWQISRAIPAERKNSLSSPKSFMSGGVTQHGSSRIFPYPIAGDTVHMQKDIRTPTQGYGDIERSLWNKLVDTLTSSKNYAMQKAQGYNLVLGTYLLAVSILLVAPCGWFSFAGGSTKLYPYFTAVTVGVAAQVLFLSLCINLSLPDPATVAIAALVLGLSGYIAYSQPSSPLWWQFISFWGCLLAVNLVYTLFMPWLPFPNVAVYWVFLVVTAAFLTPVLSMKPDYKHYINAGVISFVSGFATVACASSILGLFGTASVFDFVEFFAFPSPFGYSQPSSVLLLLCWCAITGFGFQLNLRRYKEGEGASV